MKEFGLRVSEFARSLSAGLSGESEALLSATKTITDLDEALIPVFIRTFSARAVGLLEGAEQWRVAQKGKVGRKQGKKIGIGVYLFEPSAVAKIGAIPKNPTKRSVKKSSLKP